MEDLTAVRIEQVYLFCSQDLLHCGSWLNNMLQRGYGMDQKSFYGISTPEIGNDTVGGCSNVVWVIVDQTCSSNA